MDISLSAVPAVNDKFSIRPLRDAARQLSVLIADPSSVAAASILKTGADVINNLGDAFISEVTVLAGTDVTTPVFYETVTFTFFIAGGLPSPADADEYSIVGAVSGPIAGPVAYTSAGTITINGYEVDITGIPKVGDIFTIDQNSSGISDNRNALLLAGLQSKNTMVNGNATYHDVYSELVVSVVDRK